MKNKPGCRCCGCPTIFADGFNRADNTNLGPDWEERAGAWAIDGFALRTTSSNGLCIAVPEQEAGAPRAIVTASYDAFLPTANDEAKLIVDYVDDDNYHFALFTITGTSPAWVDRIQIGKRTAGVETILMDRLQPALTNGTLQLCMLDDFISASPSSHNPASYQHPSVAGRATTAHGGTRAGVGTGALGSAAFEFDNFLFTRSHADKPKCEDCRRRCRGCRHGRTPQIFRVGLSGITGDAAVLNGTYDCELANFPGASLPFGVSGVTFRCFWSWQDTVVIGGVNRTVQVISAYTANSVFSYIHLMVIVDSFWGALWLDQIGGVTNSGAEDYMEERDCLADDFAIPTPSAWQNGAPGFLDGTFHAASATSTAIA